MPFTRVAPLFLTLVICCVLFVVPVAPQSKPAPALSASPSPSLGRSSAFIGPLVDPEIVKAWSPVIVGLAAGSVERSVGA
jgi:hypothetical protein